MKAKVAAPTRPLLKALTRKSRKLYLGLRKAHSSVLIQLRTDRIGLNQYLHKIGIAESQDCTCGEGVQSPKHIFLECRMLVRLRNEMWKKIEMNIKRTSLDFDCASPRTLDKQLYCRFYDTNRIAWLVPGGGSFTRGRRFTHLHSF